MLPTLPHVCPTMTVKQVRGSALPKRRYATGRTMVTPSKAAVPSMTGGGGGSRTHVRSRLVLRLRAAPGKSTSARARGDPLTSVGGELNGVVSRPLPSPHATGQDYPGRDTPEPGPLAIPGSDGSSGCYAARAKCLLLLALVVVFPVLYEVPDTSTRSLDLRDPVETVSPPQGCLQPRSRSARALRVAAGRSAR